MWKSLSGNSSGNQGGGILCSYSSSPIITNCTITRNSANYGGGIYCYDNSSPTFINCTISGNSATNYGGGIVYSYYSSPIITNCIIWNNLPDEFYGSEGTPAVTYSDIYMIEGVYTGTGNINMNPLFVDPNRGDYHLQFKSPCIDKGTNDGAPTMDKDGVSRPKDGDGNDTPLYDMGAYEYVYTPDTEPPVPDIDPLPDLTEECEITLIPPTATDNYAGKITATSSNPLNYTTQGTYTVTWTYTDTHGNTTTQPQKIIIDDTQPSVPDIDPLPMIIGECVLTLIPPTARDNCSGIITATTPDPLTYFSPGNYMVTWTYDDGHGNTITQEQTVIGPNMLDIMYYRDSDGDNYGDPSHSIPYCQSPPGYVDNSEDCNDADLTIHPDAQETCDGVDNDCDKEYR